MALLYGTVCCLVRILKEKLIFWTNHQNIYQLRESKSICIQKRNIKQLSVTCHATFLQKRTNIVQTSSEPLVTVNKEPTESIPYYLWSISLSVDFLIVDADLTFVATQSEHRHQHHLFLKTPQYMLSSFWWRLNMQKEKYFQLMLK